MTRTRLAGCLALIAMGATAPFVSAEVTCPGMPLEYGTYLPPPSVVGPPANAPSIFDPSFRPLGESHLPGSAPALDQITFRYDDAGARQIAPRLLPAPRDPSLVQVTFSPRATPKTHHTAALVGSAYTAGVGVGADAAFARSPGAMMMLSSVDAPEPAGYSRRPLDPATLSLSVLGIGAAGAIIALGMLKIPR